MESAEQQFLLATLPPSSGQRRMALGVVLLLIAIFVLSAPFGSFQLPPSSAFIVAFQTALFVNDLITATLIFAEFSILRWQSLLALATGYLFTAVIAIPYALSFPGPFGPTGLFGTLQTAPWLYIFWHAGLPLATIAYVFLNADKATRLSHWSSRTAIALSAIATFAAILGLVSIATMAGDTLPWLFTDATHISRFGQQVSALVALLGVFALALLWFRQRSLLDLWLMVVLCAWLLEIAFFVLLTAVRFSLSFYTSRVYALITASVVLLVMLSQTKTLYARLAHSITAERRERKARVVTMEAMAIAHEINQPLVAIKNYALAAHRRLAKESVQDAAKINELIDKIDAQATRAGDVLQSLRAMVGKQQIEMTTVDLGRLVMECIKLAEFESANSDIRIDVAPTLPPIVADEVQIQQVVINLTRNAIEAMDAVGITNPVVNIGVTEGSDHEVMVSVADRGPGIAPDEIERIFKPFNSAKESGLGIGLTLSRAIVEAHGGRLTVVTNAGGGSVFRFTLPTANEGQR